MPITNLNQAQRERFSYDVAFRVAVCRKSFFHFIAYYLLHRFPLPPADKHKEIIDSLDSIDDFNRYIGIIGFRGCAKSTILEAFATWCLINGSYNFIVLLGNTIDDSQMSLANIRDELESNQQLQLDFGIDVSKRNRDSGEKWSEKQLTIGDCTIIPRSRGQKIRGAKFKQERIDIIIGDDLEDVDDAKTADKRKKTREWFFTEVLPATKQGVLGDNVKVVLIGNLVHKECLLGFLSRGDLVRVIDFPLIDEDGDITWPGLYPDMEAIEKEKAKVYLAGEGMGHIIWAREYLLKNIDEEDMVLSRDDIQYYPLEWLQRRPVGAGVGVDLAISKKQTADFTAMVKGIDVLNDDGERRLLVLRNNINKRFNFGETIKKAVDVNQSMISGTRFYVEKVNYQEAALEVMRKNNIPVVAMAAVGDKRARLITACYYVKTGRVLFPSEGCEDLITNIVEFGIADHDDLADAFAYLVLGMVKKTGGLLIA